MFIKDSLAVDIKTCLCFSIAILSLGVYSKDIMEYVPKDMCACILPQLWFLKYLNLSILIFFIEHRLLFTSSKTLMLFYMEKYSYSITGFLDYDYNSYLIRTAANNYPGNY